MNLSEIKLGSPDYSSYRRLIYVGPKMSHNLVPIAQDEEGYVHIAAGTYGRGKFVLFPWIEKYLKDGTPPDCVENWKYKGTPYTGCSITYPGSGLWCPTSVDSSGEYVVGSGLYRSCSETRYEDGEKIVKNAVEWMAGGTITLNLASYPDILHPSAINQTIEKKSPSDLSGVDIYFVSGYGAWSTEDISFLESYLEQGGNIIVGSADSYTVAGTSLRKPMRSFVTKLGLFDREATTKIRVVETSSMPVPDDVFAKTTKSVLIEGNIPSARDAGLGRYMKEKLTYIYPGPLAESWLCKEVLLPGFIKLIENPIMEQYIPEFGSYFQARVMPYLLQDVTFNTSLPAEFPPKVNSTANMIKNHSVTINNLN